MADSIAEPVPEGAGTTRLSKPGFEEEALPWLDAVYRFALRLTAGDADRSADLVQETYLRAYRHWETYTRGTSARSWLFTICRNVFLRTEEQRGRRPEVLDADLDFSTEAIASVRAIGELWEMDPEHRFFNSFVDDEVVRAVERLPAEFREAVVLSDFENLSYAEIAEVAGVPIGTVKSRLYRGRRLLAGALRDYAVEMGYARGGGS